MLASQLLEAVRCGDVELGCIPVENSLAGTIHKNYDLLVSHDLHIVGEVTIPISHCLMANRGVKLEDVKVVLSHPVALAQCEGYIKAQGLEKEVTYDTAGSAEMVMLSGTKDRAAIAGKTVAARYNLDILASGVQDESNNYTRFLILSRQPTSPPPNTNSRTTFLIGLPNRAGSLVHALTIFSMRGLDLSKLESRPLPAGKLGDAIRAVFKPALGKGHGSAAAADAHAVDEFPTMFVLDVFGATTDTRMQNAIRHLQEEQAFVRVLGSYPIN